MELLDKAQRWADHDLDPATASSLKADIEAARGGDEEALAHLSADPTLDAPPRAAIWAMLMGLLAP